MFVLTIIQTLNTQMNFHSEPMAAIAEQLLQPHQSKKPTLQWLPKLSFQIPHSSPNAAIEQRTTTVVGKEIIRTTPIDSQKIHLMQLGLQL